MPVPLERAGPTTDPRRTAIAASTSRTLLEPAAVFAPAPDPALPAGEGHPPTLRRLTRLMRLGLPVALLLATAVAALGLSGVMLASPGPAPAPAAALTLGGASPGEAAAGPVDGDAPGCATAPAACGDLPRRGFPARPARANCCP